MKSKSFELPKNSLDMVKQNKTLDFIKYYKPAPGAETQNNVSKIKLHTPNRQNSPKMKKKIKKEMDIPQVNIDGTDLPFAAGNSSEAFHVTSTPNITSKKDKTSKVKSIMKNSIVEETAEVSEVHVPNIKPKKRNKSVSFMLEENEEVVTKKSKSEESITGKISQNDKINNNSKKNKNKQKSADGKENKSDVSNKAMDHSEKLSKKKIKTKSRVGKWETENKSEDEIVMDVPSNESQHPNKTEKKLQKMKKSISSQVPGESSPKLGEDSLNAKTENKNEDKVKKLKKKKHQSKPSPVTTVETDGEPVTKSKKKDLKPEIIAEGLENLNIGDNPHSLSSLIDEMTVADKNKKKKPLVTTDKKKEMKSQKQLNASTQEASTDTVEEKERVKWIKRKFNKDKKGSIGDRHLTSIIVENLPLSIICIYKKLLTEHFTRFGVVRQVGSAEVYPTEDPKPVFTTTIVFCSEDAAVKSLEEDNTLFSGSRIRIKQSLPPTQTTLVVHSYAELSMQALSSLFSAAGRIRNIHNILKGKKASSTAFIEFDGPDTLNRALKMAENVKIGGKRIHVAKYEIRKTSQNRETNNASGA